MPQVSRKLEAINDSRAGIENSPHAEILPARALPAVVSKAKAVGPERLEAEFFDAELFEAKPFKSKPCEAIFINVKLLAGFEGLTLDICRFNAAAKLQISAFKACANAREIA